MNSAAVARCRRWWIDVRGDRRPPSAHPRCQGRARTATTAARRSSRPAFADLGFDVDIGPLFATPGGGAASRWNDVHIVGISSLAAGHRRWCRNCAPRSKEGRPDIMIVVGGVIPPQDFEAVRAASGSAIFPPGTVIADAAADLIGELNRRLGYAKERRG